MITIGTIVHFRIYKKNGIDPLKASPSRKYYEFRGWKWVNNPTHAGKVAFLNRRRKVSASLKSSCKNKSFLPFGLSGCHILWLWLLIRHSSSLRSGSHFISYASYLGSIHSAATIPDAARVKARLHSRSGCGLSYFLDSTHISLLACAAKKFASPCVVFTFWFFQ